MNRVEELEATLQHLIDGIENLEQTLDPRGDVETYGVMDTLVAITFRAKETLLEKPCACTAQEFPHRRTEKCFPSLPLRAPSILAIMNLYEHHRGKGLTPLESQTAVMEDINGSQG